MSRPRPTPATHRIEGLPTIFANAAGIDIGADEIVVAVPPDLTRNQCACFAPSRLTSTRWSPGWSPAGLTRWRSIGPRYNLSHIIVN
jgi:hypothetical protein